MLNNPQGYIDPTGFGFWDDLFDFFFGSFSSDNEEGDTSTSSSGGVGGIIGALITLFSSLDSEVVNKAELRREALKQKPNIFNQLALTSQTKLTNPNTQNNPGNDYPNKEPGWWEKICIGPCDAHAGDEGVKVPPWWPPRGRPGGIAVPGGKNKPIEYRPPTPGQRRHWEDFLNREGRAKLEKEKLTAQKTLEQHYRKLAEIYQKEGYPNPVEQTILRRQNDLEIINDLLSKIPR